VQIREMCYVIGRELYSLSAIEFSKSKKTFVVKHQRIYKVNILIIKTE
jgi:hypothetical protein